MRVGINPTCRRHDPGRVHPDRIDRLDVLCEALGAHDGVAFVEAPPADRALVERVHHRDYLADLEAFCADGGGAWDPDTIASTGTWDAAHASAGLAVWAAEAGIETEPGPETPFALCRPPGHHATPDSAMGFCFFNNVAIGAERARALGAARVAILDWDVHHANGTEAYVETTPAVALVSMHQRGIYPGTGTFPPGADDDRVLNLPLPTDLGDADYLAVLERAALPALAGVDPDLLLVSCGFDAHRRDVLASQRLTAAGFGLLADATRRFARDHGIGLAFVLEGGYALAVLGACAVAVVDALAGTVPDEPAGPVDDQVVALIERAKGHPMLAG